MAEALERAAARGVACRVLADAVGSRRFHRRLAPRLRRAGVDVRKGLPPPLLGRKLRPLDLGNHPKPLIVDGHIAHTGSMNLMDVGADPRRWREVVVRVRGPAVLQMQMLFDEDWRHNAGDVLPQEGLFPPACADGDAPLQVVPSGPTDRADAIHDLLVAAINGARDRIVLTTPYFVPDEPTRIALQLAALPGEDRPRAAAGHKGVVLADAPRGAVLGLAVAVEAEATPQHPGRGERRELPVDDRDRVGQLVRLIEVLRSQEYC